MSPVTDVIQLRPLTRQTDLGAAMLCLKAYYLAQLPPGEPAPPSRVASEEDERLVQALAATWRAGLSKEKTRAAE
ncbi:hypothetical protein [uncultured Enterovirga sp.]|uniref:hypothetical protein n=1 Tax=uncultured Enterovirga sp. TaxID=2026352 RepID=UPI0035CBF7E0